MKTEVKLQLVKSRTLWIPFKEGMDCGSDNSSIKLDYQDIRGKKSLMSRL